MRTAIRPEDGVSENIGAILLVMVVVLAVSIIGVFMFSQPTPQKMPALNALIWNDSQNIYIRHEGGDPLSIGEYQIIVDGVNSTALFNPAAHFLSGIRCRPLLRILPVSS